MRGGSGGAGGFHALGADSHGQQQHDGQSQRKQFLHFLFLPFHYCFLTFLLPTIAALIFPLAKMYISRMGANWIIGAGHRHIPLRHALVHLEKAAQRHRQGSELFAVCHDQHPVVFIPVADKGGNQVRDEDGGRSWEP